MPRDYQPFQIQVGKQEGGSFPVEVVSRGTSIRAAMAVSSLPLSAEEIEQAAAWLERGLIDHKYARDFGDRLFRALFQGEVLAGFRQDYQLAAAENEGLRVMLSLPPELAGLPWELMYDQDGEHGFLARSMTAPLVRHLRYGPRPHTPPRQGPLRVLIAAASPRGYPLVSGDEEAANILASLSRPRLGVVDTLRLLGQHLAGGGSLPEFVRRLRRRRLFEVDVLPHASRRGLVAAIETAGQQNRPYHVVHFIGHGSRGEPEPGAEGEGYLLFEAAQEAQSGAAAGESSPAGPPEVVSAYEFAEAAGDPNVNLVVLNACQTASTAGLFAGIVQQTVQRGVPAVIGMQTSILDRTAARLAGDLYGAWADGEPIEAALAQARRFVPARGRGAAADWSIPVLYMALEGGLRLQLAAPRLRLPRPVRWLRWSFAVLLSLISTVALLLQVPNIARAVRTEVPIIRCAFPYPMPEGSFNVVITEFGLQDPRGSPIRGSDGRILADYLARQVDRELAAANLNKISYMVRGPGETCRLGGHTPLERRQAAEDLAGRIGANLVVYGLVVENGSDSRFSPEFYVDYRGFAEAPEITGAHQMGTELGVDLPLDSNQPQDTQNPALAARTRALSLVTIGLAYYQADQYPEAIDFFSQAEAVRGWLPDAGKEVIYLLLGNANVRRASKEKSAAYLDQAAAYYATALSINPAYARARLGNAGVLYLKAFPDLSEEDPNLVDVALLDASAAEYRAVLQLDDSSADAVLDLKAHLGLGQIQVTRAARASSQQQDWQTPLAEAGAELGRVVQAYEGGRKEVAELAGHAYAYLGLSAWMRGQQEEAVADFGRAIPLVSRHFQAYYRAKLGQLYQAWGQTGLAAQQYEAALAIANALGDPDGVARYSRLLNQLNEEAK